MKSELENLLTMLNNSTYSRLRKFFYLRLQQYHLLGVYQPDEILSEAIIRLKLSVQSGKQIVNVEAWLRKTGAYYVCELSRSTKNYILVDDYVLEGKHVDSSDRLQSLEQQESMEIIHQALEELNLKDRLLLKMRFFGQLSWEQIADRLSSNGEKVTTATLRKRGERANVALRKIYQQKISS